ncbi:hypothetical protein [Aminobacter niigataensis]|nr:hypothetical protein [Aminobacter niigataensis]CAI2932677.1 protein of unknown function [Aminobacter niigataensis]
MVQTFSVSARESMPTKLNDVSNDPFGRRSFAVKAKQALWSRVLPADKLL